MPPWASLTLKPLFQGVEVKGVDDGRNAFALQGMGHRVQAHFLGFGDLLDADDDFHSEQ